MTGKSKLLHEVLGWIDNTVIMQVFTPLIS